MRRRTESMAKQKYYVVWKGRNPGIYSNWDSCKQQIDGFEKAQYKSFPSREEAEEAYEKPASASLKKKKTPIPDNVISPSISVDAACSGNPGIMEYQGVDTLSKRRIFHQGPFPEATVNIGEFLAIVHALAMLKKIRSNMPIYSDSNTAIAWLKKKKVNTKLEENEKNKEVMEMLYRAEKWVQENEFSNEIIKWPTRVWGEIPADFGRK